MQKDNLLLSFTSLWSSQVSQFCERLPASILGGLNFWRESGLKTIAPGFKDSVQIAPTTQTVNGELRCR